VTSTVDPEALDDGPADDRPSRRARRRSADGTAGRPPRRRRFRTARLAVKVGLLVGLGGIVYLTLTYLQVWQASRTDGARPSDAIIVLGAAQYDCEPSPVLRRRLDHAHELYDDGVAPRIVVTGGKQAGDRCTEAAAAANYLRAAGVPDGDILPEVRGTSTWESIAASANFLGDDGWDRVVLVTDGYHAFRVRAIAEELGLDAAVSPVGGAASSRDLLEETGVVAVGRVIGFRRLVDIDDRLVSSTTGP